MSRNRKLDIIGEIKWYIKDKPSVRTVRWNVNDSVASVYSDDDLDDGPKAPEDNLPWGIRERDDPVPQRLLDLVVVDKENGDGDEITLSFRINDECTWTDRTLKGAKITVGQILQFIYDFYHDQMSEEDFARVMQDDAMNPAVQEEMKERFEEGCSVTNMEFLCDYPARDLVELDWCCNDKTYAVILGPQ